MKRIQRVREDKEKEKKLKKENSIKEHIKGDRETKEEREETNRKLTRMME